MRNHLNNFFLFKQFKRKALPFRSLWRRREASDLYVDLESRNEINPEDILSDDATQWSRAQDLEKKLEIPVSSVSYRLFFPFIFLALLFFGSYVVYLFVEKGSEYSDIAYNNARQIYKIGPSRGDIISSDGYILASSASFFNLIANPSELVLFEAQNLAAELAELFDEVSYEFLLTRIMEGAEKNLGEVVLLKNLSLDEAGLLINILEKYQQVGLIENLIRTYPQANILSHVIGYTAPITEDELKALSDYGSLDYIGKDGVEYYFEKYLRGSAGLFAKVRTALGELVYEQTVARPRLGFNAELTIDFDLQTAAYDALARSLKENNIKSGAVVVLEASSSKVLALISMPDFNPNDFTQGLTKDQYEQYFNDYNKPLFNRAIAGEYATGSVIKPIIAAAALEENIIESNKYLYTEGFISVTSVYDPSVVYTFLDWKNHGWVDMREAIAVSSNVYFYTIGGGYKEQEGLGIDKIIKYLKLFGWGKILGINFGKESAGLIPSPQWKEGIKGERWTIGDTYNVSIGQGDILATPLQVAVSTAVFANKGTLYRPYIVDKLKSANEADKIYTRTKLKEFFLSPFTIKVVREGMREAVVDGSSSYLSQLNYDVAGKTGTAQAPGGGAHAWFTGFAPYENPSIVVTVLLENGESSSRAVRVAYDIFKWHQENRM